MGRPQERERRALSQDASLDASLDPLADLLLRRCRVVLIEAGSKAEVSRAIVQAELFNLGYTLSNPDEYTDSLLVRHSATMKTLAAMRGGGVSYVPLYTGFPDKVPEPDDYLIKRLLGYVMDASGWDVPGTELENGMRVPQWLFDLDMFSANPVTQRQDWKLFLKQKFQQLTRRNERPRTVTPLRLHAHESALECLAQWLRRCLTSKTSYPEAYREDFVKGMQLLPDFRLSPREVEFREHRALYCRHLWTHRDGEGLADFCCYPSDILRLMASLTDGDLSLATKIKFPKMKHRERRRVLALLEQAGPAEVVEDQLFRFRGLWLALERSLHSGQYRRLFPRAHELLARLQRGDLKPRFTRLEQGFTERDSDAVFSELRRLPPGVSLRRASQTLALSPEPETLEQLAPQLSKAALKDLFIVHSVLQRDGWAKEALVLTKRGSSRVIDRHPERLPEAVRAQAVTMLSKMIEEKIQAKYGSDSWRGKSVYLSPEIQSYMVPTALRSASDAFCVLGRGSVLELGPEDTLRLFVYWKQNFVRTDVDLSALVLDSQLRVTQQVSWTNLKGLGILHSGDLQSAPFGAAEFIDVKLSTLQAAGHRYLAAMVYRYAGEHFSAMTCYTGWMMRDRPDSTYASFDIATVRQKMNLTGEVTCALPVIFDLEQRLAIWTDLRFFGTSDGNALEGAYSRVERALRVSLKAPRWKLNLHTLGKRHAEARGATLVDSPKAADIVFGLKAEDRYNPGDWSKVLSELL